MNKVNKDSKHLHKYLKSTSYLKSTYSYIKRLEISEPGVEEM
jgi:hypothetical protein